MRILPITINNIFFKKSMPAQRENESCSLQAPLNVDTISFWGSGNRNTLRKLLKYQIPDMFTGRLMISRETYDQMESSGTFNEPIHRFIRKTKFYKKCLLPIQSGIYSLIKDFAQFSPELHLNEVIKMLVPKAQKHLVSLQIPVFDELGAAAQDLPPDILQNVEKYMSETRQILNNKPIRIAFNKKDFMYKLNKVNERIIKSGDEEEIRAMRKLLTSMMDFPHDANDTLIRIVKKPNKRNKIYSAVKKNKKTSQINRRKFFENLHKQFQRSVLSNDDELTQIFEQARAQILNIPTTVSFSRKKFINDLKDIISSVPDEELKNKLIKIATKLPSSVNEPSAFIMKLSKSNHNKIGYALFSPSIGTIEHLVPQNSGKDDNFGNLGLSASLINGQRADISLANYMRKHPDVYKNIQKYIDRLIFLCNGGIFQKIGLPRNYITDFAAKVRQLSPPENPISLSLKGLRPGNSKRRRKK